MLTKKNYRAIALCFSDQAENIREKFGENPSQEVAYSALDSLAYRLSHYLASDNPNFNRQKFLAACELKEKV